MAARKDLFARALSLDPERLHFAAHSHHLWPDASFDGQVRAWVEANRFADRKWDLVFGEVVPERVARAIVLARLANFVDGHAAVTSELACAVASMLDGAPLGRALPGRIGLEIRATVQGGLRILEKLEAAGCDMFRARPVLRWFDWPLLLWRAL